MMEDFITYDDNPGNLRPFKFSTVKKRLTNELIALVELMEHEVDYNKRKIYRLKAEEGLKQLKRLRT